MISACCLRPPPAPWASDPDRIQFQVWFRMSDAANPSLPPLSRRQFASSDEAVREIQRISRENQRFLICGHSRPDGDCIGSSMGLYHYLLDHGKEVRLFFRGPVLDVFDGIVHGMAKREEEFPKRYAADVTICLDCGSANRIVDDFQPAGLVINIDHHMGNTCFGHLNWIDANFAAVGEMIYLLIEGDRAAWTPEIASCLYLAVVTDTGAFRYSNTKVGTFRVAARLVEEGADPCSIAARVWGNRKVESCLIAAAVWNNMNFELDGRLVWSEITQALFAENGGEANEPDNLVSELVGVDSALVAVLLRETSDGGVRASFRSKQQVDVNLIAIELGGGGHRHAAGLESKEPYAQIRARIIETTIRGMRQQLGE